MSDRLLQADIGDATFDADVVRWSADPNLAAIFAKPDGAVLVLDTAGERVRHANNGARVLRASITTAGGGVRAGLRIADALKATAPEGNAARVIRIRLDSHGIARPTACLVARAISTTGEPVLLLTPIEPLPVFRKVELARAPLALEPGKPLDSGIAKLPEPSDRFVWRSDAANILTDIAGGLSGVADLLIGRTWCALVEPGAMTEPNASTTLRGNETFRALPLTIRVPSIGHELDVELSGTPQARPGQPFAGLAGFGIVRGVRQLAEGMDVVRPETPVDETASAPVPPLEDARETQVQPPSDNERDIARPPTLTAGTVLDLPEEESTQVDAQIKDDDPAETANASIPGASVAELEVNAAQAEAEAAPASRAVDLSTHEHAAFREIARALGARFAGDDEPAQAAEHADHAERRNSVTVFPGNSTQTTGSAIDAAIVSALDRLPAGVLVHRDGTLQYANRRFLELTDYSDRAALEKSNTLAHLLSLLPPREDASTADMAISITTGAGSSLSLAVERSRVDWEGGAAELLLVRAAAQVDRTREAVAQGLMAARDTVRERDAQDLIDAVEDGIAMLDESGRILTLNRSARTLLRSDAREIVGGSLEDVVALDSQSRIAASLAEAEIQGSSEPREISLRAGDAGKSLRLRVTRLPDTSTGRFCAALRHVDAQSSTAAKSAAPQNATLCDFLDGAREKIRSPVGQIVTLADALLTESERSDHGERDRERLARIRTSGVHVLEVVDDLVDLALIEAGRGKLNFTDIALNDVVSGCIAQIQPQAARDRIVVRTSLSPDLRPLVADERSMRQATFNVISNAIRLTEAGGQVIVSTTTAERGEIAFRVRDTGIGMTEDEIERALAPLSKSAPMDARDGTGLELTLTKALVEANRGRFLITSRKNEGTLVEMLFPAHHALSA